ncbi:hypothetical protein DPMN_040097 [Dreissena polymorpha]|nr:hypothetical protein DPMN_040097 [Dreissena polymorpha]
MLTVSDLSESDDCTCCCDYYAYSLRLTREYQLYRLLSLQMLTVSDLPESDDCTGCCACKCLQSQTYPRVTTVQAAVPTNASSF